jgi:hypothetical protein
MKLESSRLIFEKYSNTKLHENPSSGSRVVLCGRMNGQTDMTKPIVAFRNFASAPKNRKCETTRSPNLICDHGICQEGLRKTTNILVRIRLGFEPDTFRIHVKSTIFRVKFVASGAIYNAVLRLSLYATAHLSNKLVVSIVHL